MTENPLPVTRDASEAIQDVAAEKNFDEEILAFLSRQSSITPIPVILAMAAIAACAHGKAPDAWVFGWLLTVSCMQFARTFIMLRLASFKQYPAKSRLRVAVIMSAVNGLCQIASLMFFPLFSLYERAIQTMIFIGTSTIAVVTTAGYRRSSLAYTLPVLIPLFAFWAWSPGIENQSWYEWFIALIGLVYLFILLKLANNTFNIFQQSYEARWRQQALNKQLQIALQEAEIANRSKTRFLAAASHDLRQPIHTLSLFGAALGMQKLDDKSKEIAGNMDVALQALATQLDALLDISKLDAGVVPVNRTEIDLKTLLNRLHEEFKTEAIAKGVSFSIEQDEVVYIFTDELLLERVLRNLLSNAVKYTCEGSIKVEVSSRDSQCIIHVIDTGRGIPQQEFPHIFEEFYQLDNPERDKSKGLGLGLAIVKRLVDLLDIEIQLTSSPNVGTRFTLNIPISKATQAHVMMCWWPKLIGGSCMFW